MCDLFFKYNFLLFRRTKPLNYHFLLFLSFVDHVMCFTKFLVCKVCDTQVLCTRAQYSHLQMYTYLPWNVLRFKNAMYFDPIHFNQSILLLSSLVNFLYCKPSVELFMVLPNQCVFVAKNFLDCTQMVHICCLYPNLSGLFLK